MKANIFFDMKQYAKLENAIRLSNKFPKYIFDSYNKRWNPPKNKNEIKEYKKGDDNKQKNTTNIQLPKGVEYIKISENYKIKECINDIEFKNVTFNKRTKRYLISLEKELCEICELYNDCIASKADAYNKISLKESIVKKLQKQVKINKDNKVATSKDESYNQEANITKGLNNEDTEKLINDISEKYSEAFNEGIKVEINKLENNQVNIKESTNDIETNDFNMEESMVKHKERNIIFDVNSKLEVINFRKMNLKAYNYANKSEYSKAINIYYSIIDEHLDRFIDVLRTFDLRELNKYSKMLLKLQFNSFEEIEDYCLAELYNNLGRMYLSECYFKEAKVLLEKAIELSPEKYTNSYLSLGDVYMKEENYIKARKYYNIALKLGNLRGELGIKLANKKMFGL